jgi:predicted small secreted protein
MLRKHASLIIATSLLALLTTACIVRTSRPPGQRAHPVHVEKHKKVKHKKVKHKKHR